jgi:hypothetical protein
MAGKTGLMAIKTTGANGEDSEPMAAKMAGQKRLS